MEQNEKLEHISPEEKGKLAEEKTFSALEELKKEGKNKRLRTIFLFFSGGFKRDRLYNYIWKRKDNLSPGKESFLGKRDEEISKKRHLVSSGSARKKLSGG